MKDYRTIKRKKNVNNLFNLVSLLCKSNLPNQIKYKGTTLKKVLRKSLLNGDFKPRIEIVINIRVKAIRTKFENVKEKRDGQTYL